MDIKILSQNIANNPSDFSAEELEKFFILYAKESQEDGAMRSKEDIETELMLNKDRLRELRKIILGSTKVNEGTWEDLGILKGRVAMLEWVLGNLGED